MSNDNKARPSLVFAKQVFHRKEIKRRLPAKIANNWLNTMDGLEKIHPEYLDPIANAIKEWAIERNATHYSHWFQPLRSMTAEKHESFLSFEEKSIDQFREKNC